MTSLPIPERGNARTSSATSTVPLRPSFAATPAYSRRDRRLLAAAGIALVAHQTIANGLDLRAQLPDGLVVGGILLVLAGRLASEVLAHRLELAAPALLDRAQDAIHRAEARRRHRNVRRHGARELRLAEVEERAKSAVTVRAVYRPRASA